MYSQNCLPAGFSDSDEGSDFDDEFCNGPTIKKRQPAFHVKSGFELKKEILFKFLKDNNLEAIKNELDHSQVKGFNIDDELDGRWNFLFLACSYGCSEIVQYLIQERGACVNTTVDSESPIMVACYSTADSGEVLKIVKTLVNANANFSLSNMVGVTPLMFASSNGHIEVVKYLLSINDALDAIDNEGKNSLFHAIDGKHVDIAQILMEAGIDLAVVNKFGNTAKDFASNELQEDIVALFPPEVYKYQPPCNYLSYNRFEDVIPSLSSDVPLYFPDIIELLHGMNCNQFIDFFAQSNVNLEEFLTITDERLKEIGIEFPFERKMIKMGLHNFHSEAWSRCSLFLPESFEEGFSDVDLVMMLANILRQLVVVKSHIHHVKRLGSPSAMKPAFEYFTLEYLNEFGSLTKVLEKMLKKEVHQNPQSRPLLIIKKKKKRLAGSLMKIAAFTAISIVLFGVGAFRASNTS